LQHADEIALPGRGARILAGVSRWLVAASAIPRRDPFAFAGLLLYLIFVLIAIFAESLITHDPREILFDANYDLVRNRPPGGDHILGTTYSGRDIYSQLVMGTQGALVVGVTAAICVVTIGTVVGLIAGFFGGLTDTLLMRLADIALGVPFLPFVIVLAAFLNPSQWNVVLGIALLLWPQSARVIRAQVMSLRERAFIEAARVTGAGPWRILFVHIAPNVLSLSFLYASIAVGWAILTEASISFLGFGDPKSISWGFMLQDAFASQALSKGAYYWFMPPGILIILIVSAGFFITRGYEQILFPKLDR